MAESPDNSPPAPTMDTSASAAASPSDGFTPPSPDSSLFSAPPPTDASASSSPPAPTDASASSSPPAPTSQDNSPPPSSPPPSDAAPPPQIPVNPQPPPSEESPPRKPPSPPAPDSSLNQSPPQSPLPPSHGSNNDGNKDKDQNNNGNNKDNDNNNNNNNNGNGNGNGNNRDVIPWPPPPPVTRNSIENGPSTSWSLGPPRSDEGSKSSDNDNSPNVRGIIGVAAGTGLLLLLLILLCICCKKKKKKRKSKFDDMPYFNSNNSPFGGGAGGGGYYSNVPPQDQYHQNDHVMNMTSPGGRMGANWGTTQSPQTHVSGGQGNSNESSNLPPPHPSMGLGTNQSSFTYDELAVATQGFADSNLLGQGGFGYVHKGVLANGKEVAVKSLKVGSGQGEREFQAEVEIISRVHHRYLVSLVGYCTAGTQRLLVYEFLPNNTLEFHLHGKDRPVMDWSTRMKIAMGSAKGLAYLHEDCHPRIIHRDIKASNILLDFSFEAKVADFGLAKLSQDNYTHVSTRVMGTFGYLAPEYASSGKLTEKSDVFSFGVMLLELVTGRTPVDLTGQMEDSLVDWARPLCLKAAQDGDYDQLADPRLERNYDQQEMARMAACAAAAIRHSARRRPKMSQLEGLDEENTQVQHKGLDEEDSASTTVTLMLTLRFLHQDLPAETKALTIVRALEGDVSMDDITEGVKPGQSTNFSPSSASSEYDASSYSADMRRFRKLAMDSKNYQSSEFGHTSEYGLNPSTSSSEEMHRSDGGRTPEM